MPPAKQAKFCTDLPFDDGPFDLFDSFDEERKRKVAKKQESQLELAELNDDCLLNLMQCLTLNDLCSLASTCSHLKQLSQKVFTTKHRTLNLDSLIETEGGHFTVPQVQRLLHNFGHLISSLTINVRQIDDREKISKLIWLLRKYCIGTLDEMVFDNHPEGERLEDIIPVALLGMEIMVRDRVGNIRTKNCTMFYPGKTVQTQEIVDVDDEGAFSAEEE